jgi:hypothetical protein
MDSQYDATFKLSQQTEPDGTKKQFLEILGSNINTYRTNVEITTRFNQEQFP